MSVFKSLLACLVLTFVAACGVDIQPGSQRAGQQCFFPSDCADGLTCYNRACAPVGSVSGNNGNNGQTDAGLDTENDSNRPPDVSFPDFGIDGGCIEGQRQCISDTEAILCIDGAWDVLFCDDDESCRQGDCVSQNNCVDRDGDGFGFQCPRGDDCDDGNARVNPAERENCNTPFDDNCDRRVNENCDACCAGGCNDDEFCGGDCTCKPFDPNVCLFQNQPCSNDGQFDNGYYCISIDGVSASRCYGVCNQLAADPNSTCPEAGSVCAFGGEQQGFCFSGCALGQGCGGDAGLGCLPWGDSPAGGMCIPTTPQNQIGDSCDSQRFFDCAEGALCIDFQGNGNGRCEAGCRPFASGPGDPSSDCNNGHCLGFSADIGICQGDNNFFAGDTGCFPQSTPCNEDAVACYQTQQGQNRCQRLCRVELGDADCLGNQCFQFDPQQDIGICAGAP